MARPLKTISWKIVEKKAECGISASTIAFELGIDLDTFYRRFKREYGKSFGDFKDEFIQSGRSNIIFTQYMKALSGNSKMLELLGREWLGQGKEQEKISPMEEVITLTHENIILKAELQRLKEKVDRELHDDKPKTE